MLGDLVGHLLLLLVRFLRQLQTAVGLHLSAGTRGEDGISHHYHT